MTQARKSRVSISKPDVVKAAKKFAENGKRQSGVPAGSLRLSVNVRVDIHDKLKTLAFEDRTTIGKMIEGWAEKLPAPQVRRRA